MAIIFWYSLYNLRFRYPEKYQYLLYVKTLAFSNSELKMYRNIWWRHIAFWHTLYIPVILKKVESKIKRRRVRDFFVSSIEIDFIHNMTQLLYFKYKPITENV